MKALTELFSKLVEKIRDVEYIDEATLQEIAREIQRTLLKADVPLDLVKTFTDNAVKRIREEKPPAGIPPREYLIYVLYEELVKLMGGEQPAEFKPTKKPYIVLLLGVEGSGKTTTSAKLARYLMKRGYKVGMVETDTIRPAAFDQLRQLAEKIGAPFYGERDGKDAVEIARRGVANLKGVDVLIIDTAGRHRNEEALLQEVKAIYDAVNPDEVVLVVDATVGKLAAAQAEAFMKYLPIHTVIITKMDSTARGGGALAAVAKTGARVKFIGVGEDVEELEPFNPRKFVARLLGMGDLDALLEKIKAVFEEEEVLEEIESGRLDLLTFKKQIDSLMKLGPLSKVFQLLPGGLAAKISEEQIELSQKNLKKWRAILSSMTMEELKNPDILNASRIRRIALGAGVTPKDVKEMLTVYENLKKMSKTLKRQMRLRMAR
ncbi:MULTISPECIES: signal recognition particle protein Srp54 [Pyrobaculum]|uniref:Signal recognition particle 54 kDa protein n=2 Tax=Pyrobaculum arsenaticum TaxID=121277 RepID=SRP54_PYRAR|nr:signal recognition particle protein Srp54 [Pyrobaculum arsenaticum]A4WLQ3.1 RecName: Full=Signal recognition particle 54 kDa protein; Short=SRP54 [Pyrobaculum arsenaticum DSM 13514]ABP51320.1 signal recognition particle subunit FFH/SRP54 (srp54) [Pyrobaculum arsenaticum DSM 13514]MCY0889451.1 signal recognition particle protein Srp54 [Pyrobaculum arsenaticum]NYR16309.1 signal recognition particle protein [Pyrobaculum arsenaticum]